MPDPQPLTIRELKKIAANIPDQLPPDTPIMIAASSTRVCITMLNGQAICWVSRKNQEPEPVESPG